MTFFLSFYQNYTYFFNHHFRVKICEKSNFVIHSLGKSKGNKAVSKFGPSSSPIHPLICPAAHFFTRAPFELCGRTFGHLATVVHLALVLGDETLGAIEGADGGAAGNGLAEVCVDG